MLLLLKLINFFLLKKTVSTKISQGVPLEENEESYHIFFYKAEIFYITLLVFKIVKLFLLTSCKYFSKQATFDSCYTQPHLNLVKLTKKIFSAIIKEEIMGCFISFNREHYGELCASWSKKRCQSTSCCQPKFSLSHNKDGKILSIFSQS